MKLHLPKILCMAVMGAMTLTAIGGELTYTTDANGNTLWNVGAIEESDFINVSDTYGYKNYWKNRTTYTKDLILDGSDRLGIYDEAGNLIQSTENGGDVLITGFGQGIWHIENKQWDTAPKLPVTNCLDISNLYIKEDARVALGGQFKVNTGGKYDFYAGIKANSITIEGTGSGVHLESTMAHVNTLTMNSGTAHIHHDDSYNGGCSNGYQSTGDTSTSMKMAVVETGLYMNGGNLYMGRSESGSNKKSPSSHVINKLGGEVVQKGGNLVVTGKTLLSASVMQSGGTMSIADGNLLRLNNSNNKITQGIKGTMTLGEMVYGSSGTSNSKLELTQEGSGTIHMKGARFKTDTKSVDNISSINQTKDSTGTINMSGTYENVVFKIKQEGKDGKINLNLNKTTVLTGTAVNEAKLVAQQLSLGTDSILNVNSGTLSLNEGGTFEIAVNSAHDAAMNLGDNGEFSIVATTQALSLSLHEAVVSDMMDTVESATESGLLTYTIDLISATDISKLNTLSDKLTWEWEGLPQTATLAADTTTTVTSYEYIGSELDVNQMDDGTYMLQAAITWNVTATEQIPEPATATLSLLALAGLAARRRRR